MKNLNECSCGKTLILSYKMNDSVPCVMGVNDHNEKLLYDKVLNNGKLLAPVLLHAF